MNIDDLKMGEFKELKALFSGNSTDNSASNSSMYQSWVGKYVICRTRNEGVNAGVVEQIDDTGVVLEDARRLWYHKPADKDLSWYEGVAESGLAADDYRISNPVKKLIAEDYSLTLCTSKAEKSIRDARTNKQS